MRKVLFILGQLTDSDADWLGANGVRRDLRAGTELIAQGSRIDAVYFVLEGDLAVVSPRGAVIARVSIGDVLGEMSLIDSQPTSASVRATRDSRLLAIPKSVLVAKLAADDSFAARFYRALALFLADRMRNTIARMGFDGPDARAVPEVASGELDEGVLDSVGLAGARFDRMLKRLQA